MSTKRLLLSLHQRLRRAYTRVNQAVNRRNISHDTAPVRVCVRGRTRPDLLLPAVAIQAFGLPGILQWGGKKEEDENKSNVGYIMTHLSVHCKSGEDKQNHKGEQAVIAEADRLYAAFEVADLYEYLIEYKETSNPDVLWRLARATTDMSKKAILPEIKEGKLREAYGYIERAIMLIDTNSNVHKWYAILLDYTGELEGTKKRISNAFKVKDHFLKALELNPNDPTTLHSLGYWCYVFADLKWYQKTIASALYATPPSSTFQEALDYFQQAEQMEPNFYSANLLMLGKTYMRLRDPVMAYTYLKKCVAYPQRTPDDKKSFREANELMKSMGLQEHKKTP